MFSIIRILPLQSSWFFPYTTLFRSSPPAPPRRGSAPASAEPERARDRRAAATRSARHRDRKSTRLNSSHLVISYAVFCLKKKIYTIARHQRPLALQYVVHFVCFLSQ